MVQMVQCSEGEINSRMEILIKAVARIIMEVSGQWFDAGMEQPSDWSVRRDEGLSLAGSVVWFEVPVQGTDKSWLMITSRPETGTKENKTRISKSKKKRSEKTSDILGAAWLSHYELESEANKLCCQYFLPWRRGIFTKYSSVTTKYLGFINSYFIQHYDFKFSIYQEGHSPRLSIAILTRYYGNNILSKLTSLSPNSQLSR